MSHNKNFHARRRLLKSALAGGALTSGLTRFLPAYAQSPDFDLKTFTSEPGPVRFDLTIRREFIDIAGARSSATTINHTVPGPVIELHEGEEAVLHITNELDQDSSIHWHGILIPFELDGVPGVSFPGIKPGETFEAHFRVRQYGTYWYHSHSGFQEQTGVYGPFIIHPAGPEPVSYDRDYVVMLSDWTFENPHHVMARLKKMSDYYNFNQPVFSEMLNNPGDWLAWANMRMNQTDIADVTGYAYSYLMNGLDTAGNWTGLFQAGERVRLRFINASAMTYFNVRIPGLPMTVIQADGQFVQPVETDEFQMAVAETLDVIVQPRENRAYTVFAESMDRSGYVRGTLATSPGMTAEVPGLREPPRRTMIDMGMDHAMDMSGGTGGDRQEMDHSGHDMSGMEGGGQMMNMGSPVIAYHDADNHGPGNASVASVQRNRLSEPGTGLENTGHRVLAYADLRNLEQTGDKRPPSRTIEIHLTGNMERYMWSFDGKKYSEAKAPIPFSYGERIRLIMVNDTMMEHPIHLHGMFMELENGQGDYLPRKHTISVKPAERMSLLITANEPGRWAFHCHFLYHMDMGMFRIVEVS
jgi:CopA family copper-resistance protein